MTSDRQPVSPLIFVYGRQEILPRWSGGRNVVLYPMRVGVTRRHPHHDYPTVTTTTVSPLRLPLPVPLLRSHYYLCSTETSTVPLPQPIPSLPTGTAATLVEGNTTVITPRSIGLGGSKSARSVTRSLVKGVSPRDLRVLFQHFNHDSSAGKMSTPWLSKLLTGP